MNEKTEINRPQWLKVLLGFLIAWTVFMISVTLIFIFTWILQYKIFYIELEGTRALILIIITLIISIYLAYQITKLLNKYLESKSLNFNYIALIILIITGLIFVINYYIALQQVMWNPFYPKYLPSILFIIIIIWAVTFSFGFYFWIREKRKRISD